MSQAFASFDSWSFSVSSGHKPLKDDRLSSLSEADADYTALVSTLSLVLQDHLNLDLEFDESLRPTLERSLGRGSSFILRMVKRRDGDPNPVKLVYKGSRTGLNQTTRIVSLVREARVLTHPPLRSHRNIMQLKGISWEEDVDRPIAMPVLIFDYAPLGSLSDFLNNNHNRRPYSLQVKSAILLDIAKGIQALHLVKVAHGDIKCQNVLIFHEDSPLGFVAKLTDFGFAEICCGHCTRRLGRGTPPWNAPEWMDYISEHDMPLTDIYSFGLLVWKCLLDGNNPFENDPFASLPLSNRAQEIEHRKTTDQLLKDALVSVERLDGVTPNIIESLRSSLRANPKERNIDYIVTLLESDSTESAHSPVTPTQVSDDIYQVCRKYLLHAVNLDPALYPELLHGEVYAVVRNKLKPILDNIKSDILDQMTALETQRVMDSLRALLVTGMFTSTSMEARNAAENSSTPSNNWLEALQHVPPMTKKSIYTGLQYTAKAASTNARQSEALVQLSICCISGFGTQFDTNLAVKYLAESAELGNLAAQAIVKRIADALGVPLSGLPILQWLVAAVETGSLIAMEDLKTMDPQSYATAFHSFKTIYCGLGVKIFDNEVLDAVKLENIEDYIIKKGERIWKLNNRGDNIVHCAASVGSCCCLEYLVDKFPDSVYSKNQTGEDPLLFACRSGNYENSMFLLRRMQNISKSSFASAGATPMHWLTSFEGDQVRSVATALVEKGGRYMIWSIAEADTACFRHYYNGLGEGTPLHRAIERRHSEAVKILLELQSSGTLQRGPRLHGIWRCSPLMLSCAMHDVERIKLLLASEVDQKSACYETTQVRNLRHSAVLCDLLDEQNLESFLGDCISHSPLYFALVPFGLHHRLCLHGANYVQRMRETVDFLVGEGATTECVNKDQLTGLFCATQSGDVTILEKVVELEGLKHLNTPCSEFRRSPLQQAIFEDNKTVFHRLLNLGARVQGALDDGKTLLQTCAESLGSANVFAIELIKRGASFECDAGSMPAFSTAVVNRRYELAELLLKSGADVNESISTPDPLTTLGLILSIGQYSVLSPLKYLLSLPLEYGEVSFLINTRSSALHFAAFSTARFDHNVAEQVFKELVGKFSSPEYLDWQDEAGYGCLNVAILMLNIVAIKVLLGAGAKVNDVQKSATEVIISSQQPMDLVVFIRAMNMLLLQEDEDEASTEDDEPLESVAAPGDPDESNLSETPATTMMDIIGSAPSFASLNRSDAPQNLILLEEIEAILHEYGAKTSEDLVEELSGAGVIQEMEGSTRIILKT